MNANEVIANRAIQLAGGVVGSKKPIHPERRRQSRPVVERHVSRRDAHRDGRASSTRACCRRSSGCAPRSTRKAHAFADVVMIGRTHLQDATPVTLGQVISGWVAQLDDARGAIAFAREGLMPLALGGTAVGTGLNAHPRVRRDAWRGDRARDRQAVRLGAEQVRRAVGARRDGQRQRRAAHARRRADEDRQRRALVRERPARGHRRDHDSRQRAGLVDHAGQDQPDAVRGADDGRGAGVRQRPRRGVRRHRRAISSSTSTSR